MAIRPIVLYPDPVLLHPTHPVSEITEEIRSLIPDMAETMYAAPGVGLAANQIGEPLRLCIIDLTAGKKPDQLRVFINPEVLETEGEQCGEEGCLSFPDVTLDITRPRKVVVRALDLEGQSFTVTGEDLLARALLHEIEHLDGQIFLRNVSSLKRETVKRQIRKRMKVGEWVAAV